MGAEVSAGSPSGLPLKTSETEAFQSMNSGFYPRVGGEHQDCCCGWDVRSSLKAPVLLRDPHR